jgi:hypothetical protein
VEPKGAIIDRKHNREGIEFRAARNALATAPSERMEAQQVRIADQIEAPALNAEKV